MKIFFTASFFGKTKYQKYYDLVLKELQKYDIDLIGTEVGNYLNVLTPKEKLKLKNKNKLHYEAIRRGIQTSDAVVIEMSQQDFQLGHEATLTIMAKKHVLCLSLFENFAEKIKNDYFHGAKYNDVILPSIIHDFLKEIQKKKYSERFNCFLSPEQLNYLEQKSRKEKINKSEYLRKLIEEDIKNN